MARSERNGSRLLRSSFSKRQHSLGYYCIFTDTTETEENYFLGLRDSMPKELQEKIVIKIYRSKTSKLIEKCREQVGLLPIYAEPWIVLDRDQVPDFDNIVRGAELCGINVGWSNPCIEVWFSSYFGRLLPHTDSVSMCRAFSSLYNKKTGREYKKSEKTLYTTLFQKGDEEKAIQTAEQALRRLLDAGQTKPSEMCPCTTVHKLVQQIREKSRNS